VRRSRTPSGSKRLVGAPLTLAWLAVLFVTTRIQRSAGRFGSLRIQRRHSTNLRRLRTEPVQVLASSLFWLDERKWWPYVPVFLAFVAPAERRLRWWRWLPVGIAAHVFGTLAGQGYLLLMLRANKAPKRLVNARDVGVSYFVFGAAGALSGYVQPPWRSRCQVTTLAALVGNIAIRPTFTEVGHFAAFIVGLAAAKAAPERDRLTYPGADLSAGRCMLCRWSEAGRGGRTIQRSPRFVAARWRKSSMQAASRSVSMSPIPLSRTSITAQACMSWPPPATTSHALGPVTQTQ
jgi:hypothetical protein